MPLHCPRGVVMLRKRIYRASDSRFCNHRSELDRSPYYPCFWHTANACPYCYWLPLVSSSEGCLLALPDRLHPYREEPPQRMALNAQLATWRANRRCPWPVWVAVLRSYDVAPPAPSMLDIICQSAAGKQRLYCVNQDALDQLASSIHTTTGALTATKGCT